MSAHDDRRAREDVLETLARITAAWRRRDFDALPALFAPDVVMALPGLSGYLEGREACVASFRESAAAALPMFEQARAFFGGAEEYASRSGANLPRILDAVDSYIEIQEAILRR